jgi:glycerol kinase
VPALAGLGAPHWNDEARGTITGMTHATQPAHLARATFEAIAQQIADVFDAMEKDIGHGLKTLMADGGASGNGFLMQLQADLLGHPVTTNSFEEIGAFGVAAMAMAALGSKAEQPDGHRHFTPEMPDSQRQHLRQNWSKIIARQLSKAN